MGCHVIRSGDYRLTYIRSLGAAALLLLLSILPAGAGAERSDPWAAWQWATFTRLSDSVDLPHVTTTAITHARDGTMWIGTRGGLTRYDGQRVRSFKQRLSDPCSLPDNYVRSLLALPDGSVLIGTNVGGLARYDVRTDRFHRLIAKGQRTGTRIFDLTPDGAGGAYVASDGGVHHYDPRNDRLDPMAAEAIRDSKGGIQVVFAVFRDADGTVWAGTEEGLWVRAPHADRFVLVPLSGTAPKDDIWAIQRDRQGRLWIGTGSDGIYMSPDRGIRPRFVQFRALAGGSPLVGHRTVRSLQEDQQGRMWAATDGMGILLIDPAHHYSVMPIRHVAANALSLAGDTVRDLALDGSGGMWAATELGAARGRGPGGGVLQIGAAMPDPRKSLSDDNVRGILVDRQGVVWLGFSKGAVDALDRQTGVVRHLPLPGFHGGQDIKALIEANDGSILVGARGVVAIDRTTLKTRALDVPGLGDLPVISLAQTPQALLIGTYRGLFVRNPANGQVRRFEHDPADLHSLPNNEVINIVVRSPTSALVATPSGLGLFDLQTGRFTNFSSRAGHSASLPQDYAGSIVLAGRDIWVGTYGGVGLGHAVANGWRFEAITEAQGLAGDNVASLTMDSRRRVWVASAGGISVIDSSGHTVRTMSQRDGGTTSAFNQRAVGKTPDGSLLFGSPDGLLILQPDLLLTHRERVRTRALIISAAEIDGRAVTIDSAASALTLHLGRDGRTLRIGFALTDFDAPEEIRYGYRLEGFDRDWMTVPARTPAAATYTNLPAGSYWLDLRAQVPGLAPQVITRRFRLVVDPQWYETWPARVAMALGFVLGLAGLVWLVTTVVRRRARMLEAMVEKRTSELRTANARLDRLASTDPLTGLANRRTLMAALEAARQRAMREGEVFVFALLDVDHFKRINDQYGHSAGDEVLVQLSARLQRDVRADDTLSRYGGEEIAVLFASAGIDTAMAVVERLRQDVAASPIQVGDQVIALTISAGVAQWEPDEDVGTMIRRADEALYCAKRGGRDQVARAA